jgi:hypothetical protein
MHRIVDRFRFDKIGHLTHPKAELRSSGLTEFDTSAGLDPSSHLFQTLPFDTSGHISPRQRTPGHDAVRIAGLDRI